MPMNLPVVWDGSEAGMGLIGLDAAGWKQWGNATVE